jgi:hypothetical protein
VRLQAEDAKINPRIFNITGVDNAFLVHFHPKPPLILVLHIPLHRNNVVPDVEVVAISWRVLNLHSTEPPRLSTAVAVQVQYLPHHSYSSYHT